MVLCYFRIWEFSSKFDKATCEPTELLLADLYFCYHIQNYRNLRHPNKEARVRFVQKIRKWLESKIQYFLSLLRDV